LSVAWIVPKLGAFGCDADGRTAHSALPILALALETIKSHNGWENLTLFGLKNLRAAARVESMLDDIASIDRGRQRALNRCMQ